MSALEAVFLIAVATGIVAALATLAIGAWVEVTRERSRGQSKASSEDYARRMLEGCGEQEGDCDGE